jgi:hypothetical protein
MQIAGNMIQDQYNGAYNPLSAKEKPMELATDKSTMLEQVRNGWWRLQNVLDQLTQNEMNDVHVEDRWTVKDVIAHLAFWESNLLGWLNEAAQGQRPSRPDSGLTDPVIDEMNAANYRAHVHRPIHDVLKDAAETHEALMEALLHLPEDPNDRSYRVWENEEQPWSVIAGNTYEHYEEHIEPIEAYVNRTGKPGPAYPKAGS